MKLLVVLFSLFVLRCCWGPTNYQLTQNLQNNNSILKELNGMYNINTLNQKDVSSYNLSMSFDEATKKISGFSGCNRFFGTYVLKENTLKFSALGLTKMLCSKEKNKIESQLLKAFEMADEIFFTKNGFSLYSKKNVLLSTIKVNEENSLSFEYLATSRGIYKKIKIDKDSILLSKKRGGKSLKIPCNAMQWDKLTKLCDDLDMDNMAQLEAPSKKFQFDGAALAHLKITSKEKTYESSPFDHGNPPKEIATIVKEILSMVENIE